MAQNIYNCLCNMFLFFYLLNDSTQFRKLFNYHYFKFVYTIIIYFLLKCLRIYYVENNRSKAVYSLKQIIVFFILAHKDLVNIRYPIYIVISFMEQGLRMKTCLTFFFYIYPLFGLGLGLKIFTVTTERNNDLLAKQPLMNNLDVMNEFTRLEN